MLIMLTTTVLAMLYGIAWHDRPARERRAEQRSTQQQKDRNTNG
jgi:hypothetical protein